jgi:hypothetical protein
MFLMNSEYFLKTCLADNNITGRWAECRTQIIRIKRRNISSSGDSSQHQPRAGESVNNEKRATGTEIYG